MRKLFAVAAVLTLIAMMCGCGGSSGQDPTKEQPKGFPVNVKATYTPTASPRVIVTRFDGVKEISPSSAVRLVVSAKGIRIKKSPKAKVFYAGMWYKHADVTTLGSKHIKWNGKGFAPLAITLPTNKGGQRRLGLRQLTVILYDPRFPIGDWLYR